LQRGLNNAGRIVGLGRRSSSKTNDAKDEAKPQGLHFHIGALETKLWKRAKLIGIGGV
jgi:hypothetical protein